MGTKNNILIWVTCLVRVRYHFGRLLFSKRDKFMDEIRPIVSKSGGRIQHPSALFFITHQDINRALEVIK